MNKDFAIPNKAELEKHLGETFKLDGSFASLWAIEVILNVVRAQPRWQNQVQWIPHYILDVLTRAFKEMGLSPEVSCDGVLKCATYSQNVLKDFELLMTPPTPFPTLQPHTTSKAPVVGIAATPWYGLSVLFMAQEWAQSGIINPEQKPEHAQRVVDWLVSDYIKSEFAIDDEARPVAQKLLHTLLWPIFMAPNNLNGELNLPQVQRLFTTQTKPDHIISAILKLLVSQDLRLSLLAGATCYLINICPTSPLEARCLKRSLSYFKTLPPSLGGESHDRITEVVRMLSSNAETPLAGTGNPLFLESIKLINQQRFTEACERLTALISQYPDNALYYRTRGRQFEKLDRDEYAIDDFNKALSLKSDYWQALINRASFYTRLRKPTQAHDDLRVALALRPDSEETRDGLLRLYFELQKETVRAYLDD